MSERLDGRCLCGACTFTALPGAEADVCHCKMCRVWSGGMLIVVPCGDTLRFDEGVPVKVYRSSDWGQRLFCAECGTTLAWQLADGTMSMVSVHAFPDPARFPVTSEIYIDSKPSSYALAGQLHQMTGAEVVAKFAAGED